MTKEKLPNMPSRQEIHSEETKQAILAAAGQLFAERGFDAVTMREIAKAAGCSHTTIYIYFKDKEALLHQLSIGPLQSLREQMESVLLNKALPPDNRLQLASRVFLHFGLSNRTMYTVFFMARATRVDIAEPALEVQKLRNQLFELLRQAIQDYLQLGQAGDLSLAYARICFFTLHGIVGTYTSSDEPLDALMERLASTFDLAVEVMLAGFRQTVNKGAERK